jgi:hypothetical protein
VSFVLAQIVVTLILVGALSRRGPTRSALSALAGAGVRAGD